MRVSPLVALFSLALTSASAACTRPEPPPPPPPTAEKVEQDVLTTAFRDCFISDCDRAYAHLASLSATSPLRQSDEFRAIQYRYDADRLLRADVEPDMAKRRALLASIAQSPMSDTFIRLNANARISRLGAAGGAQEVALNAIAGLATPAQAAADELGDLRKKSESTAAADLAAVRAKIEPRVFSGKATAADVAVLRNVCNAQHDAACLKFLDKLILP